MNNNRKLESGNVIKGNPTEKEYTIEEKLEMILKAMWNLEKRVAELEKEVAKNSVKNKILN